MHVCKYTHTQFMYAMEMNVEQPQKKKSKLKDVPVTVYRIIEVPSNIEGVTKTATIKIVPKSEFDEGTATIQIVPKSELDDDVSDQISAGDPDKVNVTVTTSFVIDDDNTVKQHTTSKVIRLPIPIQHGRQHNVLSETSDTDGSGGNFILERNFMCTVCSKTFKHSSHLKRHINTHTGERVYKCDLCDKTFLDASTLSRHRKIHSGDKPWSCKICKKSFGTLGSLRRHITVHNQEGRPYQCETCKKRFPDNSSYQKHKFIHTGIKPYGCDVCGKSFVHIGDLNGHRKIHVEVKPYNCERCGKDFAKHSNYARHLLIHEGDKEFSCTICGVSYNFQSSLTRHLLTHVRRGNKASAELSSTNDENQDLGSQGNESSQETDEPTVEISDRKVVSNTNQIKVTRTKMNDRNKIKQLRRLQVLRQSERHAKSLLSLAVSDPQPPDGFDLKHTEPVTDEPVVSDFIESDPTVLPPQDELISKQTTTEDVTTLLSSAEDFGSTKDIPHSLLQPRNEPDGSTSSGCLISLLSDSTQSEYVLPTNESDEIREAQTSGNNGAIISDPNSVITIISISDDSVTNVGNITPSTSISDCSDVVVAVLESTETDDMIAGTIFSDIHHEDHNNGDDEMKEILNGGGSKQVLVKVSDTKAK